MRRLLCIALLIAPTRILASDDFLASYNGLYATPQPQQVLVRLEYIPCSSCFYGSLLAQVTMSDGRYRVFAGPVFRVLGFGEEAAFVAPAFDGYGLLRDADSLLVGVADWSMLVDTSKWCRVSLSPLQFNCGDGFTTLTRLR